MSKIQRINRVIKFKTKRKVYKDDASKFRPYLVLEFSNKEQKISTLFVSGSKSERLGAYAQYWIKDWKRCRFLKKESYVSIKYPVGLSLISSKIEKKIKQCPDQLSTCLEKWEFEKILSLQKNWKEENPEFISITLKEKDLEDTKKLR